MSLPLKKSGFIPKRNNIIFSGSAISISSQGGSLIVIDGITSGTDATVLRNLNPYDVESIFVSTQAADIQRYSSFNTVGLIEITLKDGKLSDEVNKEIKHTTEFEAPTYSNVKKGVLEDFRSTLYWNVVKAEQNTNATITYYNSDLYSNAIGMVYFIFQNGPPSLTNFEYQIKKP